MNIPAEKRKNALTRREALAIGAGSAATVVVASSATLFASTLDADEPLLGTRTPPPPAHEPAPFVLSF